MSKVIIKRKYTNGRDRTLYLILYEDEFINIESFRIEDGFTATFYDIELYHRRSISRWMNFDNPSPKKIINKAIKEIKKLIKIDSIYIPTIMRLTALKEDL